VEQTEPLVEVRSTSACKLVRLKKSPSFTLTFFCASRLLTASRGAKWFRRLDDTYLKVWFGGNTKDTLSSSDKSESVARDQFALDTGGGRFIVLPDGGSPSAVRRTDAVLTAPITGSDAGMAMGAVRTSPVMIDHKTEDAPRAPHRSAAAAVAAVGEP
jgi:hypothetical protein